VVKVLVENFNIKPIGDVKSDVEMLRNLLKWGKLI